MRIAPRAIKRHEQVHGRKPDRIVKVCIDYPRSLVFLGQGLAIEYRSDKRAFKGDPPAGSKARAYRHVFGPGVKIFTNPRGSVLYVTGGRFRVTDWMRD